ncbi:helix-turn-helix domain-containing protein [Paenibacillus sp. FSL R5-0407]|uniref:helix-turn-helix domain-containing protein n=1 Tax=Paenibacillus sp. FSL R5-0407 TaxID=2975320 RepID=UPI004040C980
MSYVLGECLLLDRLREKGVSRAEFARALKCTRAYVTQLINGDAHMSLTFAINAAHYLGCRVTDLYVLTWSNEGQE